MLSQEEKKHRRILVALLRIGIGWVFFWAFIDKLFGLGFATCKDAGVLCEKAWLAGGSPTTGFLSHASGPFSGFFQWLATPGVGAVVSILFMLGLLGIGVSLMLGAGVKLGAYGGAVLLVLMFLASPPTNNPLLDDHIIYAILLILLAWIRAGHHYGLGKWWSSHDLVKKHPWLD